MAAQPGSTTTLATYLATGYWTETGQSPHSWDTSSSNVITVNLTGLDSRGQATARAALDAWEMVADIQFREVSSGADITFDDSRSGATTTVSYDPRSGDMASATVYIGSSWLDQYGSSVGSYGFQTYMHEIGHALGLGHPGTYSGGATYANAKWTNDSWQLSVMSYLDQDENPNVAAQKAYLVTPMMSDIIAIQSIYGAPTGGPTAGNTTYGVGTNLTGYLAAVFGSGAGDLARNAMTIYDEGGLDTINVSDDTRAQSINLNPGTFSNVYGLVGNLGIATNTTIENAYGGTASDAITGNRSANVLKGNGGNDRAYGGDGGDSAYGGIGNDILYGGAGNDALWGEAGNDSAWGDAGNDQLRAGDGADTLYGGDQIDSLWGEGGDDALYGGADGALGDSLSGGDGNDREWGGGGNDRIRGDAGNDALWGETGNDALNGDDGDDRAYGGASRDSLYGGNGNDLLWGDGDLDMAWGGAGLDSLYGGDGNDTLYGEDAADLVLGDSGNDLLYGGAGADILSGGLGEDRMVGGSEADSFKFTAGSDSAADFQNDVDTILFDDALWGGGILGIRELLDFGYVTDGDVVFNFGNGNTLRVENVANVDLLGNDVGFA